MKTTKSTLNEDVTKSDRNKMGEFDFWIKTHCYNCGLKNDSRVQAITDELGAGTKEAEMALSVFDEVGEKEGTLDFTKWLRTLRESKNRKRILTPTYRRKDHEKHR